MLVLARKNSVECHQLIWIMKHTGTCVTLAPDEAMGHE